MTLSRFVDFPASEWARLRAGTPLTLTEEDLEELRGINEDVSLDEVEEIYLPLSRLLNLYVAASQELHGATAQFLGNQADRVPYVIGIGGSVAVGKSTTARILQALLSQWTDHPRVDLITTDGFLHPNHVLEQRGLLERKGFPESYDQRALLEFVSRLKAGVDELESPVYSHLTYDIVEGEQHVTRSPDIVLLEGLNVLQSGDGQLTSPLYVSDFFDFCIYIDAELADLRRWYVERFLALRHTAFRDPASYFHRYASLSHDEAIARAGEIWTTINEVNLHENILPTRERAHLILRKARDHRVRHLRLRKI